MATTTDFAGGMLPVVAYDALFQAAKACDSAFGSLTSTERNVDVTSRLSASYPTQANCPTKAAITLDDVHDAYEEFRVWAKNIGVFASGQASLDYRLRYTTELRDSFGTLLMSLSVELINCIRLLRFDYQPVFQDIEESHSQYSSDSEESIESSLKDFSPVERTAYELQLRFDHIDTIVDKLVRLAALIRTSSTEGHMTRAAAYEHVEANVNLTAQFEREFLPSVLKYRYKLQDTEQHKLGFLLDRFVKAIALRRRRFLYQSKHQQKLAYGGVLTEHSLQKHLERPLKATTSAPYTSNDNVPVTDVKLQVPSVFSTPTRATTFHIETLIKKAPSRIISASAKSVTQMVQIPPPPTIKERATHTSCPYCCLLLPRQKLSPKEWRDHVVSDLQPYICLEPDCPNPHTIFANRREWIEHQQWEHTLEYWCDGKSTDHKPMKFLEAEDFGTHLRIDHYVTNQSSIEKQIAVVGQPSVHTFSCCPFCNFQSSVGGTLQTVKQEQRRLQSHIEDELLNIFILALPEREDLLDTGTDAAATSRWRSSMQTLLRGPLDFSNSEPGGRSPTKVDHDEIQFSEDSLTSQRNSHSDEPLCDPVLCEAMWCTVWQSDELRGSTRESYTGPETDEILRTFMLRTTGPMPHDDIESSEDKRQSIIRSLAFEGMDDYCKTISECCGTTGRWFTETSEFVDWSSPHHNLGIDRLPGYGLELCGCKGSGKSTIMKMAVRYTETAIPDSTVISFFFDPENDGLRSSEAGMLRSLLHQLLEKLPDILTVVERYVGASASPSLSDMAVPVLRLLFSATISKLRDHLIICFIDGVDHCPTYDTEFVLPPHANNLRLCWSTSPYPTVESLLVGSRQIILNNRDGNLNDMASFIDLNIDRIFPIRSRSWDRMIRSAFGNKTFMWVVMITELLNVNARASGYFTRSVHSILLSAPEDVRSLFESFASKTHPYPGEIESAKKCLIFKGIDINRASKEGQHLLALALLNNNIEMLNLLLTFSNVAINSKNDEVSDFPLFYSIKQSMSGLASFLLAQDAVDINIRDGRGRTALMHAINSYKSDLVMALLSRDDVDVNIQDHYGDTALMFAVGCGDIQAVKCLLLNKDVHIDIRGQHNNTALMIAAIRGIAEIIQLLLRYAKPDLNLQDDIGRSVLMLAVGEGRDAVIDCLLHQDDIQVNLVDNSGLTALHFAAKRNHRYIAEQLLLRSDININLQDNSGKSALLHAIEVRANEIADSLLERKDILHNLPDNKHRTALIYARFYHAIDIERKLLAIEATKVDAQNTSPDGSALVKKTSSASQHRVRYREQGTQSSPT